MRPEARKYLYDIRQAVALLREFTANKTFTDYERDAMLRAAVEREFGIIGEAMTRLADLDAPTAERISDFRRIIAFFASVRPNSATWTGRASSIASGMPTLAGARLRGRFQRAHVRERPELGLRPFAGGALATLLLAQREPLRRRRRRVVHEQVDDHMRGNLLGKPEQLPQVVAEGEGRDGAEAPRQQPLAHGQREIAHGGRPREVARVHAPHPTPPARTGGACPRTA